MAADPIEPDSGSVGEPIGGHGLRRVAWLLHNIRRRSERRGSTQHRSGAGRRNLRGCCATTRRNSRAASFVPDRKRRPAHCASHRKLVQRYDTWAVSQMSCTPPFKRIAVSYAAPAANAIPMRSILIAIPSRSQCISSGADRVDAKIRWNAGAIAVGTHAYTGAARIDRQQRRRRLARGRCLGRRYGHRIRPLWLMKRRPRHRRFCSIRARTRP
jgi:hypothetical protein